MTTFYVWAEGIAESREQKNDDDNDPHPKKQTGRP